MKVGIVTIPDITNYGNRLQNYAASQVLKNYFHCDVVSLVSYKEKPFEKRNFVLEVKNFLARQLCIFPHFAENYFGCEMTRWANFYKWNKKNISERNFYEYPCLPDSVNDEYDMFFAGSDQIWNYRFSGTKYDDYFLKFASEKKRVAICASFGVEYVPDEWKQIYIDGLSNFAHISVREDAGAKIVSELIDRDVPVLIDPTMMLSKEEWLNVSKKPRVDCKKPYVLKYYLGDETKDDKFEIWAKQNGYEIYELLNKNYPELYSAGPGEFISLISNATMVCSDSFHCIVFSIIFSKPFIVYARQGKEDYMTSRLDTLLNKFGLKNRWNHFLKTEDYLKCDYSLVPFLLKEEQKKFLDYLSKIMM